MTGLGIVCSTQVDVTLEIPQLAAHRSYLAWLNQSDAELTRAVDQDSVQLVASHRSTVSVRSIGTRRQVGDQRRGLAHPSNLLQFRPGSIPNRGADTQSIEQRETRRR